jgi:hypothetical protein
MIASVDNVPSPKTTTARITDNGPKNTSANVAIASASHALVLTIKQSVRDFNIKHGIEIRSYNNYRYKHQKMISYL